MCHRARADEQAMEVRPIGVVRGSHSRSMEVGKGEATLIIEVYPEYADALNGIEELTDIQVLYWMHELDGNMRRLLMTHPRGDTSLPERGVFALRSATRPNPIGSSTVRLVKRDGNRLLVAGLDAFVGSPVIDIKHAGERR